MASDHKQIIRNMYQSFGRGDIDAVLGSMTEDVNWDVPGAAPFSGVRHGRGEVRKFFQELARLTNIDEFDVDDVLADGNKVIVLGRQRATVKETGRHFEHRWAHVYTMRDGKVAEAYLFGDTHAAASAFGESNKEKQALGGPLGITHPAYSGRVRE